MVPPRDESLPCLIYGWDREASRVHPIALAANREGRLRSPGTRDGGTTPYSKNPPRSEGDGPGGGRYIDRWSSDDNRILGKRPSETIGLPSQARKGWDRAPTPRSGGRFGTAACPSVYCLRQRTRPENHWKRPRSSEGPEAATARPGRGSVTSVRRLCSGTPFWW